LRHEIIGAAPPVPELELVLVLVLVLLALALPPPEPAAPLDPDPAVEVVVVLSGWWTMVQLAANAAPRGASIASQTAARPKRVMRLPSRCTSRAMLYERLRCRNP
jgi:hypothetical protein